MGWWCWVTNRSGWLLELLTELTKYKIYKLACCFGTDTIKIKQSEPSKSSRVKTCWCRISKQDDYKYSKYKANDFSIMKVFELTSFGKVKSKFLCN